MSTSYCIKCKSKTEDVSPQVHQLTTTRGIKYQRRSTCKECHKATCQFISAQHAAQHQAQGQGLITDLVKKFAPQTAGTVDQIQNTIGSIPFIGPLLGAVV